MKIILLFVTISLAYADPSTTSAGSTETSNKAEVSKSQNTIPSVTANGKASYYSSTRAPTYVQLVQKPLFAQHPQTIPQTMLIIAQPALIPHNVVYNQASNQHAQLLLNYFHSNPAAKYQLLYGYQPMQQHYQVPQQSQHQTQAPGHGQTHQQHQPPQVYYAIAQPVTAAHSSPPNYQTYQYLTPQLYNYQQQPVVTHAQYTQSSDRYHSPSPQYQIPASTYTHQALQVQPSHQSTQNFIPSQQITQPITQTIAHLTQPQTQTVQSSTGGHQRYPSHYYNQGPQTFTPQTPLKTAAPIITGLENFTPEQQAQIKEQLSSHFGGLTQINSNSLQANSPHGEYSAKFRIDVNTPSEDYSSSSPSSSQTGSSGLKQEAREESQHSQPSQHQHYASPLQSSSYAPPSYTYRTPPYTKG